MKRYWLRVFDLSMSAFKYLLALSMMVSGIQTIFLPLTDVAGVVGVIYGSHIILAILGVYIFVSGFLLAYGKIRKHRRVVGWSLMMIYCAYVFATIVQALAGLDWVVNLIMAVIVGLLYLRWKYHKFYSLPARAEIRREKRNKLRR